MDTENKKARWLVYGIIAALILVSLFSILIFYHTQGSRTLGSQFFRFAIVLFFCIFVYLEHEWARWGMGIFAGLGGIYYLVMGIQYFDRAAWWPWPLGIGVCYIVCAAVLLGVPLVRQYFRAGKGKLL